MMKLSVIIPCYNESTTILSLIDAVKQSPISNREIIIVDDGSKDGRDTTFPAVKGEEKMGRSDPKKCGDVATDLQQRARGTRSIGSVSQFLLLM